MIGPIGPVVTDLDTVVEVPFTVTDIDTDLSNVQVLATSNNPTLLPAGALTIIGLRTNRILHITPASGQSGTAVVTLRAFDGQDDSEEVSFTLNVNEDGNPAPDINERPTVILPAIETVTPFAPDRILIGILLDDPDGDEPEATVTVSVARGLLHFLLNGFPPGATTGNGTGSLSVTASLANIRAALSMGSLIYRGEFTGLNATLTVIIDDKGSGGLGPPLSASASTQIPLAIQANQWLSAYSNQAQRDDPTVVGPNADFDNDGYPTLVEYAFAMDPRQSAPTPLMEVDEIEIEGLRYLTFTYRRLTLAADPLLLVTPEIATDDFSWGSGPGFTVLLSSHLVADRSLEEVTMRSAIPLAGSHLRQMVRLRIACANQR